MSKPHTSRTRTKPTVREKYDWLCKHLEITNSDRWECDALLKIKKSHESEVDDEYRSIYFAFSPTKYPETIDQAIVFAIQSERS